MLIQTTKKLTEEEQIALEELLGSDLSDTVKEEIKRAIVVEKELIKNHKALISTYKSLLQKIV